MGETRQEVEFSRTCAFCDGGPTQPPCVECSGAGFLAVAALVPEGSLTAARLRLADAAEAVENAEQLCRSAPSGPEYDAADKAYDVAAEAYQAAVDALAALRTKRGGD